MANIPGFTPGPFKFLKVLIGSGWDYSLGLMIKSAEK